jgi:hypothetical protein
MSMPTLVEEAQTTELKQVVCQEKEAGFVDNHPLFPVFTAILLSLMLSGIMIGAIVIWLSLPHPGLVAK